MNSIRKQCLAATAGAVAVWSSPALAQETAPPPTAPELVEDSMPRVNADYIDITASAGYSTNPFLEIGDSQSSAYGRLSARGVHAWGGERSRSSIAAFVEGTGYLNDYGFESIFSVTGDTLQQVSEQGLVIRISWRHRGSCRAVEQSLPLRTAAPASARPELAASACHGQRPGRLLLHGPPVPDLWTGGWVDPDERTEQPDAVGRRPAHHLQG